MKKAVLGFSVLALGVVSAAGAGTVYVPVLQPSSPAGHRLPTRLWISNLGTSETSYRTAFLPSGLDGAAFKSLAESAPRTVGVDRTLVVDDAAESDRTGLLAFEAESDDVQVDGWIESRNGRQTYMASVPTISEATRFAAGAEAFLNGVSRTNTAELALANLGSESAFCKVDFVREDGTLAGGNAQVEVAPLSLAKYADAFGLREVKESVSVRASCDQPFYALALEKDARTSRLSVIAPATAYAAATTAGPISSKASLVFERQGAVHEAVQGNEKLKLPVPVPGALKLDKLVWDADVTAGPWNARLPACAHNIAFFHRGRFRSNTFSNLNAFGPNRNWMKNNQNIDQPAGHNTNARIGFHWVQGTVYHIQYIFDAVAKMVHITNSINGIVVGKIDMKATAENHILTVPTTGLMLEMGNLRGQVGCEVPSYGWKWANLRLEMFQH
jgi:hypothetical protein